jgi:hypothetical protein
LIVIKNRLYRGLPTFALLTVAAVLQGLAIRAFL